MRLCELLTSVCRTVPPVGKWPQEGRIVLSPLSLANFFLFTQDHNARVAVTAMTALAAIMECGHTKNLELQEGYEKLRKAVLFAAHKVRGGLCGTNAIVTRYDCVVGRSVMQSMQHMDGI